MKWRLHVCVVRPSSASTPRADVCGRPTDLGAPGGRFSLSQVRRGWYRRRRAASARTGYDVDDTLMRRSAAERVATPDVAHAQ